MSSSTETSTPVRRSVLLAFLTTCLLVLGSVVMLQALADIQTLPRYKALIIGINDYSDNSESGWPDLKAATKDTDALVDLLRTQYGFKPEDVTYLHDGTATRDRILDALDQVIGRATAQDAVLLYYAGHGATKGGEYYWIPSDATKREKLHREGIPTSPLEVQVKNSVARHVLLVVDSCFAGYMGERRSGPPPSYSRPDPVQLEKQLKERGRHLLVSTDRTTALDQTYTPFKETVAYGGHSPFAAKFLGILKNNTLDWLEAKGVEAELTGQLYKETRQWADLKNLSLESSGMFVFHNVLATQSPRPGPSGLTRDPTGGVTLQKEARLVVKSTMGGKLFLDGKLLSEKAPPQAEWDISTGPGSLQLELRGPCETVNRLVNVQEGQAMEVSLEGSPGLSCTALPKVPGSKAQERITWVSVPAGEFTMGSNDGETDEKPPHKVKLSAFKLSKTEVTVAQYNACVQAGKCPEPTKGDKDNACNWKVTGRENHPINCVDWEQAKAFTVWLSGVAGQEVRLPSEAQWEYAARGKEGRKYPWGKEEPIPERANYGSNVGSTTPVGQYPKGASWVGALDMAGNVWEWCLDSYAPYNDNDKVTPVDPVVFIADSSRVLRGGAWNNGTDGLRGAYRSWYWPGDRYDVDLGFRVVCVSVSAEHGIGP